jgi:uncharacterized protein YbjT (DUF2867 family)
MKTISLSVSESDYEAFREVAEAEGRPVALMIREAMAAYRVQVLEKKKPLRSVPVLVGHRQVSPLPTRDEIYAEVHAKR